ncbi:2-hydroxyacid dehydrogenase [Pelomonas sp. KK5]|uniref:2-hydroxyacid dehydrogenase n=1 Tax=Pelomonas sp. KK5 TaxID=1855730 RepID=UPI00097CAF63|nr:2-hydroxyacid dehydrogenase [Pelomonas sp. KK5]
MSDSIHLLTLVPLPAEFIAVLAARYTLMHAPAGPEEARTVQAVLTNGSTGLSAAQMAALPALRLVHAFGAGYEAIDLAAARSRGVIVSHAPGANDATVADHAMALLLAVSRGLVPVDRAVKAGGWEGSRAARPTLNGRRLGIVGMGLIGQKIARRAEAFDMQVAYHTRQPRLELPYAHHRSLLALAEASDCLVLACPGGAVTRHIVNREVLRALGPKGFLVNIARGSVVHTGDLIAALQAGEIAGAGLDVLEDEPEVPAELAAMDQVVLTPHMAGRSPEAQRAQLERLMAAVDAVLVAGGVPANVVS